MTGFSTWLEANNPSQTKTSTFDSHGVPVNRYLLYESIDDLREDRMSGTLKQCYIVIQWEMIFAINTRLVSSSSMFVTLLYKCTHAHSHSYVFLPHSVFHSLTHLLSQSFCTFEESRDLLELWDAVLSISTLSFQLLQSFQKLSAGHARVDTPQRAVHLPPVAPQGVTWHIALDMHIGLVHQYNASWVFFRWRYSAILTGLKRVVV